MGIGIHVGTMCVWRTGKRSAEKEKEEEEEEEGENGRNPFFLHARGK